MITAVVTMLLASQEPNAAGLVDRFAQVQDSAPSQQPTQKYAGWSRNQLLDEQGRLEATRPSLAFPITFLVAGVACVGIDAAILLWAGFFALFGNGIGVPAIAVLITLAVVAVAGIITGLALLFPTLRRRSAVGEQLDEVNQAIEQLPVRPPPTPFVTPPPMQVQGPAPWLTLTLARF